MIYRDCDMNEEEKEKGDVGENETYRPLVRNSPRAPAKKNERACHVKGHVQS